MNFDIQDLEITSFHKGKKNGAVYILRKDTLASSERFFIQAGTLAQPNIARYSAQEFLALQNRELITPEIHAEHIYWTRVVVHQDHQGEGIAGAMLEELLCEFKRRKAAHYVSIFKNAKPPNGTLLLPFFQEKGYVPCTVNKPHKLSEIQEDTITLIKDYAEIKKHE